MTCKTDLVNHQGTRVQILSEDKQRWENIGDIMDVKPPKASFAEDDVTTLADTDKTVVTAGPREHSNIDVTLLKRTTSTMQKRLELSSYNGTCERFRIITPDAKHTTTEFSGYIKEYGDETDPAKKTRIAMSITVSGKVGKYDDDGYITPDFYTEGPALTFGGATTGGTTGTTGGTTGTTTGGTTTGTTGGTTGTTTDGTTTGGTTGSYLVINP